MTKKTFLGNLLLILAAIIWGGAFIAQKTGLETLGPITFNGVRSLIGALGLGAFLAIRSVITKKNVSVSGRGLLHGLILGIIVFFASTLQQLGLATVNAGRAGFLTAIYIVMVPIIKGIFGKKVSKSVLLAVCLALAGLFMLSAANAKAPDGSFSLSLLFSGFSVGDILIICGSFFFSLHIIAVDSFVQKTDGVMLSCLQFAVSGLISVPVFLIREGVPTVSGIFGGWTELLYAGLLSCAVAYTLQILGQKLSTNPTVAAVLMSTESMFAAIFGMLLLSESHLFIEYLGCVFVFAAVIVAQLPAKSKADK